MLLHSRGPSGVITKGWITFNVYGLWGGHCSFLTRICKSTYSVRRCTKRHVGVCLVGFVVKTHRSQSIGSVVRLFLCAVSVSRQANRWTLTLPLWTSMDCWNQDGSGFAHICTLWKCSGHSSRWHTQRHCVFSTWFIENIHRTINVFLLLWLLGNSLICALWRWLESNVHSEWECNKRRWRTVVLLVFTHLQGKSLGLIR